MQAQSGKKPVTLTIQQGQEPDYFLEMFSDGVVIFEDLSKEDKDFPQLFHVKSNVSRNAAALQISCNHNALNSGDCFILRTETKIWSWHGFYSNTEERTTAESVSDCTFIDSHDQANEQTHRVKRKFCVKGNRK